MGEDLSTAYKIAAGACIMAFILSIGLSLMMIGRNFWNKTADQVTTPVTSMQDTDAFFLASYYITPNCPIILVISLNAKIPIGARTCPTTIAISGARLIGEHCRRFRSSALF